MLKNKEMNIHYLINLFMFVVIDRVQ